MRRASTAVLLLLPLLAAAQKPAGPSGDLHAKDHAPTFYAGEVITLEAAVSSATPNKYLEPCDLLTIRSFGFPQCRFFNPWSFSLQTPDGAWTPITEPGPMMTSGPTFEVPDHDLSTTPIRFTYDLTQRHSFETPGKYTVRLTTQIALDDNSTRRRPGGTYTSTKPAPHTVPLTLDYTFNIIPATADWQHSVIARGVDALESNRQDRGSNDPSFRLDQEAIAAICNLHTTDAAIALARVLADGHHGDCIVDTNDRPAAEAEMHRLLADPNVGVTLDFLRSLALLGQPKGNESGVRGIVILPVSTLESLSAELFRLLPQKTPKARLISLATAISAPDVSGWRPSNMVEDHFPDALIQAAADNFEALPEDLRNTLLNQNWRRIRSPLMLAAVRHEAESGNGQAVLDWQDLDPAGANAFIRAEIVNPIPRFYAYYLQLPETTLPDLEDHIVANMLNFPPGHDLAPSATLVARYATAASLPKVLAFYDQRGPAWFASVGEPLLAYLLRVSPRDAAPRLATALANARDNTGLNTYSFFTDLGMLCPSQLLEELAFQQIQAETASAPDAARYLQRYGSPSLKPHIWAELVRLKKLDRPATDSVHNELLTALVSSYAAAQGWVLSPADSDRLQKLLGADTIKNLACNFSCGHPISIAPGTGEFTINRHEANLSWSPGRERIYLWPTTSPYSYSINQYAPPTLAALLNKLAQFPPGSTFVFAAQNPGRDHREWIAISDFLTAHGYHLRNPYRWDFLPPDTATR